jgi:hypothetical protein
MGGRKELHREGNEKATPLNPPLSGWKPTLSQDNSLLPLRGMKANEEYNAGETLKVLRLRAWPV